MIKNIPIIAGFLPWIVFSILYGSTQTAMLHASIGAVATALIFNFGEIKLGFVLPVASLIYFVCLSISYKFGLFHFIELHPNAVSNGAIAAIIWLSILIKQPFTLQYARKKVPSTFWKSPLFLKVNWQLTFMWAIALTIGAIPSIVIPQEEYAKSLFWNYVFSNGMLVLAIYLNSILPPIIIGKNFWDKVQKLPPVDSPYLKGGFAPVHREIELDNLEVDGTIPQELNGLYLRNGSNPYFTPYTYTYPIDGDGMIHQIKLHNGQASYKNVFVKTNGLIAEIKADKALYGGIALSAPPDPRLTTLPQKSTAAIHIVKIKDKFLALYETAAAYLLDADLHTIGQWMPNGEPNFPVNAHHRIDSHTGQIYMCTYEGTSSALTLYEFNANYDLIKTTIIEKDYSSMIHDFVITKNYIVFFDAPAIFDFSDFSKPPFGFRKDLPLNIILIERSTYKVQTIRGVPSFFVYHFINAYEVEQKIILDFAYYEYLALEDDSIEDRYPPKLYRGEIDLTNLTYSHKCLFDQFLVEFPSYNLEYTAKEYRYGYLVGNKVMNKLGSYGFNHIVKYDFVNNIASFKDFGIGYEIGEAVYIPKKNSQAEDDGYLILYRYNCSTDQSDCVILDAKNLQNQIACIKLPLRVPHGLHGSWNSFN